MSEDETQFVLIGAGLPRTGTSSLREALQMILPHKCYHMDVINFGMKHHNFWQDIIDRRARLNDSDWHRLMHGYSAGVDYPTSYFYKHLMKAFPNAKVLLTVRDPTSWYRSVKTCIIPSLQVTTSPPGLWVNYLFGYTSPPLVKSLCELVPESSSSRLNMLEAVEAGEEAAVTFYNDHVEEVKAHVPAERLLVYHVGEGWDPLCKFLAVPTPTKAFPHCNDTKHFTMMRKGFIFVTWLVIFCFPVNVFLILFARFGVEFVDPLVLVSLFLLGPVCHLVLYIRRSLNNLPKQRKGEKPPHNQQEAPTPALQISK